jgi:alkylation response protein AidB-like acyl-CoA dehydrogenase
MTTLLAPPSGSPFANISPSSLAREAGLARALRSLHSEGHLGFALPAMGQTRARFASLVEAAATDLSLARLVEGHVDAVAILHEVGATPAPGKLYGVWAAESADAPLTAVRDDAGWRLRGTKRYCSGAVTVDHALVTARCADGSRLFHVDTHAPGVVPVAGTWPAIGMAGSGSLDVTMNVVLPIASEVGRSGFYLERRGFWHGAVGVAACWLGGSVGCARMLAKRFRTTQPDAHAAAHFGAIVADCSAMWAVLSAAADEIDACGAVDADGRRRALIARQVVEQGCQRVLQATGRASGSSPLAFDAAHARRAADLILYLRQHHAERDAEALARLTLEETTWS